MHPFELVVNREELLALSWFSSLRLPVGAKL